MSKLQKKISITLLVVSILLISSLTALAADGPFTLVGELDISGTSPDLVYMVGTQAFVIDPVATTCTDAAGASMLCTALVDGMLVEVKGTSVGTTFTAATVAVLTVYEGEMTIKNPLTLDDSMVFDTTGVTMPEFYVVGDTLEVTYKVVVTPTETKNVAVLVVFVASGENSVYEYQGEIVSFGDEEWVVGAHTFLVDENTTLPDFYAKDDTVLVTFKMTPEGFLAQEITFVASAEGNTYEYTGPLMGWDGTTWTVGDYDFDMSEVELPIYFNEGDTVELIFKIVSDGEGGWVFVVQEYTLTTLVDPKVESNRCLNDRHHPGVQKIADDEGVDYDDVLALFCKGFGLGEIKLAFRYSQDSAYTPEMLLDLRAMGYSWGDLKKMAQGNIPPEGYTYDDGDDSEMTGNGKNKEKGTPPGLEKKLNNPDESAGEVEITAPDGPGNSENAPGQQKDKDNNGKGKNK